MNKKARHGASYFLTLIDDYSQYGYVYFLSHRHEALDYFKCFVAEVENKHEKGLKTFMTNRGREYLSNQFKEFCEEKGILRHLIIPHTTQQNGVAKRRNRTLLDMTRSMMVQANLPISFWGNALLTSTYILNRVPSLSISSTPHELWHGKKPNLEHLRPWGLARYVHNANHKYGKLGLRSRKHTFIRYPKGSKGYVMFGEHPDGGKTEVDSRDVDFIVNDFPSIGDVSESLDLYELEELGGIPLSSSEGRELVPEIARDSGSHSQPSGSVPLELSEPLKLRRSNRGNIPYRHFEIEGDALLCTANEPSYREALSSPTKGEWMDAMKDELSSMDKNSVWELVDLPLGRNAIGNKWVLKVKSKEDRLIDKYKACLMAKGFIQQEGIGYDETFSPVVRVASIRLILAIVAQLDLELYQMDVKTTFLNGELDEEIYMSQPMGFEVKGQELKVCKLKHSIYGLKQLSRQWYFRFHDSIISHGFEMIKEDHCVYLKRSKKSVLILSLYVDDILIAGNDMDSIVATKKWLFSTFEMKDVGEAHFMLRIEIIRDHSKKLLGLSQETYIKKILERFSMENSKPIDTPVEKGVLCALTSVLKQMRKRNACPQCHMLRRLGIFYRPCYAQGWTYALQ